MVRVAIVALTLVVLALVGSALYGRFGSRWGPRRFGAEQRVVRVQVINGSGEGGVGARVASLLREGGFHVVEVKNADRMDYSATMVVARKKDVRTAEEVSRYLGGLPLIRQAWSSDLAEVTVVLGSDRSRLRLDSP